jgi:hypothetical protein
MFEIAKAPLERLSEMGDESLRIIANWGPDRFATGLLAAGEQALAIGPRPISVKGMIARTLVRLNE